MSKYKVEDEVLVRAKITCINIDYVHPIEVEFENGSRVWLEEKDLLLDMSNVETIPQEEVQKSAYNQGLHDAWELAKRVVRSPKLVENAQIFIGENIVGIERESLLIQFFQLSPQEALAKLKEYEGAQEIKVGDVVVYGDSEVLITKIYKRSFDGIQLSDNNEQGSFGDTYTSRDLEYCKKTGKHIDIQSILDQIGGE